MRIAATLRDCEAKERGVMAMVAPQGRRNDDDDDDDDDSMRIRDLWTPSVKVALRNGPMVELAPQQQLNLSVKRDARQARSYSRKLKTLKERYRRSIDVEDPAKGERAKTKDEKVSAFFRVSSRISCSLSRSRMFLLRHQDRRLLRLTSISLELV
jgi:hypothetical protein